MQAAKALEPLHMLGVVIVRGIRRPCVNPPITKQFLLRHLLEKCQQRLALALDATAHSAKRQIAVALMLRAVELLDARRDPFATQ